MCPHNHPTEASSRASNRLKRALDILYWVTFTLVMLLYVGLCLHAIANYWQWGHNGYNGSAFAQAARNSIRFAMVGQAQYYTALEPPNPDAFYTHHPLMLHFHLIAMFSLFGYDEWIGRLVPAVYSCLTPLLLFFVVKRYFGKAMALGAMVAYVLIPLNTIFANMINHEQGSIFWCLFFIYMYLRWMEDKSWLKFALIMFGVSMAIQFDWPGYYLAFFVVLHAFFTGLTRDRRFWRWRPEYTFTVVFSVVVLTNFILFYLFIIDLRGGFDEMAAAFRQRSDSPDGYFALLWQRTLDLQGIIFVVILCLWLLLFVARLITRKANLGDSVPFFFLLAQLVHSLLFQQAGYIHAYWTYHLSPTLAIAAPLVLLGLAKQLPRLLRSLFSLFFMPFGKRAVQYFRTAFKPLGFLLALLIVIIPTGYQTVFAYHQFHWGISTGSASYAEPYDDQFLPIRWIQHVTQTYNRENSDFLIHPGLGHLRIEWYYYLDSPYQITSRTRLRPSELEGDRKTIILVDLVRARTPRHLARLVESHHTIVYDQRYVLVDTSQDGGTFEAYVHQELEPSWLWRWLVNYLRPPIQWVPDPAVEQVRQFFSTDVTIVAEQQFGGWGGLPVEWDCPKGLVLAGFDIAVATTWTTFVAEAQPLCRLYLPAGQEVPNLHTEFMIGPNFGSNEAATRHRLVCPADQLLMGIFGRYGLLPDSLGLICAKAYTSPDPTVPGGWVLDTHSPERSQLLGGPGGSGYDFICPAGSVAWGFRGNVGLITDAIGISCARFDHSFLYERPSPERSLPSRNRRSPRRHASPPEEL